VRRALVTGATGLVGSHIVDRLEREGWALRALVRDATRASELAYRGVELARGDVLDEDSFTRAAQGCDVVFHTAATIVSKGGWEAFRRLNVGGTRNAVNAAARSGARLLQLSSVAVYGPNARFQASGPTVESTPLEPLPPSAHYARSKRESEAIALEAHAAGTLWATAIRPDVIYGRRDRQFVPRLGRLLSMGRVFPFPGGGRNTLAVVHAANVADGAVRAATTDSAGGRAFNIANDFDVTVADFVRLAGEGLGVRVHGFSVPESLGETLIAMTSRALRIAGRSDVADTLGASVDFLARDNPFSSDLARRELGWSPVVRPDVGVPDAFRWWREQRGTRFRHASSSMPQHS
jgi:nucleoside-diphosphate-sugar epimerase